MIRMSRCIVVLTALLASAALPSTTWAQTQLATGKPTVFKVTVTKVELYNGTSFVTIFSGSSQLDLVTAAGEAAFPGISTLSLPTGTYSQIRVTFSNSFVMRGSLASAGTTYYTTATTLNGGTASQASTSAAAIADATIINPDWGAAGVGVVQTIAITPVTISAGGSYAPTLKFTVTNSLVLSTAGGIFFFTLAGVTVSIV